MGIRDIKPREHPVDPPSPSDKLVEWIEEDDGSLTAVCERADRSRYELRGCKLELARESAPDFGKNDPARWYGRGRKKR